MKIDRITFKNNQVWIAIYSDEGEYLGTWHVVHREFADTVRSENPQNLEIW
jgi:hypothetical protein